MTKAPSPLLGYNNNVRHKNRVFHVQTEDSGVKHPHIITHLFMDGGRILKSIKQSYAEFVGAEGMGDIVRNMMKEQHKAMLIALRDGQFDHLVDPKAAKPAGGPPSAPGSTTSPASAAGALAASGPTSEVTAAPKQVSPTAAKPPVPAAATQSAQTQSAHAKAPADDAPATARTPRQPSSELTLDIEALERAAKDAEGASPMFAQQNDLPPPPQNLLRDKGNVTGSYRTLTPAPEAPAHDRVPPVPAQRPGMAPLKKSAPPPPKLGSQPPRHAPPLPARPPAKPAPAGRPGEGRYAPARPAAIFGQSRPPSSPTSSLFGEDLISDKSLDEVILSYLAEDLEPTGKKKT